MFLATVTNELFLNRAKRLIDSYYSIYPEGYAYLFVFGKLSSSTLSYPGVRVVDVPMTCPHAHDPLYFYFKNHSLSWMANNLEMGSTFLYLDAAHIIIHRPTEIEDALEKDGVFLLKFPPLEKFKLKYHATKKCFGLLDCDSDEYKNEYTLWAAIQAYKITRKVSTFLLVNKLAIRDQWIIAPGNRVLYPDGINGECIHYCPEQSILSLMAMRFGYKAEYDTGVFSKYGDKDTIGYFYPEESKNIEWDFKIRGRVPA